MNGQEFVRGVHDHVFLAAVEDVEANLEDPPGRAPAPDLVRLSAWYKSLSGPDQASVLKVARMGADYAVFGLLAALDGASTCLRGGDAARRERLPTGSV